MNGLMRSGHGSMTGAPAFLWYEPGNYFAETPEGRRGPDHLRREYAAGLCGRGGEDLYDGGGCNGMQTVWGCAVNL